MLSNLIYLPAQPLISLVGAGGKTTTMYTLARELARAGQRVVTTTTTQIFRPTSDETEQLIIEEKPSLLLDMVKASLQQHRHVTIAGSINERSKLMSVPPDVPALLLRQVSDDTRRADSKTGSGACQSAREHMHPVCSPRPSTR